MNTPNDSTTPERALAVEAKVRVLRLHLRGEYWRAIADGTKTHEYRLADTWERRIAVRDFDELHLFLGYPRRGDESRIIRRPWRGYEMQTITHPHFGPDPVRVLAIRVSDPNARANAARPTPTYRNTRALRGALALGRRVRRAEL